jgi:anhydro-N-acetylmuramic acid kinase
VSGAAVRVGGLMSGTSLDGVDAVVLEVSGLEPARLDVRVLGFRSVAYGEALRVRLRHAMSEGGACELARLHVELGEAFARALLVCLDACDVEPGDLAAVGSHGQTFWHDPPTASLRGASLQLGCAATLAERVGVPVVGDLRSRDLAAGGHGAPLVPWADWVLFRRKDRGRALQNLGGMGNVTFLPADEEESGPERVRAFDTGPGVALIDGAARRASGGTEPWDVDGARAARGRPDEALLGEFLEDAFFREPPPRSTGRERFGEAFLDRLVERVGPRAPEEWDDLVATLTHLTARSVARSYRDFLPPGGVDEVVLTGGGARNLTLVRVLERELAPLPVRTGAAALGMDPDAREAAAFALLAWAHLQGVPGNVPAATGARGPRVLGSLTPGRRGA